jgi:hypothetical protein
MRVIGEIPHPDCKITLFSWNDRYLIKLEQGLFEQTFKVNQYDLPAENVLYRLVNEQFITEALSRFQSMEHSLMQSLATC